MPCTSSESFRSLTWGKFCFVVNKNDEKNMSPISNTPRVQPNKSCWLNKLGLNLGILLLELKLNAFNSEMYFLYYFLLKFIQMFVKFALFSQGNQIHNKEAVCMCEGLKSFGWCAVW